MVKSAHDCHSKNQIFERLTEAAAINAKPSAIPQAFIVEEKMPEIISKKAQQMFHCDAKVDVKDISQKMPANVSCEKFFIGSPEPDIDCDEHELDQGKMHRQRQRCEYAAELQSMD